MKTKYLRVTMPDNSKWDVPARLIAHDRAKYYAEKGESYQEEYDYVINDDSELIDWAAGNMNWSDVKDMAMKIELPEPKVDYQEGWVNGEKEIIEVE